jgi:hypothetical protein
MNDSELVRRHALYTRRLADERFDRTANRVVAVIVGIGFAVAGFCYVKAANAATKPAETPMMIVSVDSYGGEWISGRGDTCEDAWENANLPADLVSVECVPDDSAN